MRSFGTLAVLSLMLFIQACAPKAQDDCGFQQNVYGERISWKKELPIVMYLHSSVPNSMVAPILDAAETWNRALNKKVLDIRVNPTLNTPIDARGKDGVNMIYFNSSWEADRSFEQGRTSVYWIGDQIKEADIRLNAYDYSFDWKGRAMSQAVKGLGAQVNIEALVLHELGHVLGLKHKDTDGSVMATYLSSFEDRVKLSVSDEAALSCEY